MRLLGIDEARESILRFLEEARKRSTKAVDLNVLLFQIGSGTNRDDEPLQSCVLRQGELELRPIADDVISAAEAEVERMGAGFERVAFTVMIEGQQGQRTFSLRVLEDEQDPDDPFGGPAPIASQKAAIAMFMQHTQVLVRSMHSQATDNYRLLQRENAELRRENAELRRERTRYISVYEEMVSANHEREMEIKRADQDMKLKERLGEQALRLGAPLVNAIAGRKVVSAADNGPETPLEFSVDEIVSSLTEDQIRRIMSGEQITDVLTGEQKLIAASLFQLLMQRRAAKQEASSKSANGATS
jgi:hypothetical protein